MSVANFAFLNRMLPPQCIDLMRCSSKTVVDAHDIRSFYFLCHQTTLVTITPQRLPHLLPQPPSKPLRTLPRRSDLRRRQRARKPKLAWDPLDAVRGVDVLDERDLVAGCAALARDDG